MWAPDLRTTLLPWVTLAAELNCNGAQKISTRWLSKRREWWWWDAGECCNQRNSLITLNSIMSWTNTSHELIHVKWMKQTNGSLVPCYKDLPARLPSHFRNSSMFRKMNLSTLGVWNSSNCLKNVMVDWTFLARFVVQLLMPYSSPGHSENHEGETQPSCNALQQLSEAHQVINFSKLYFHTRMKLKLSFPKRYLDVFLRVCSSLLYNTIKC